MVGFFLERLVLFIYSTDEECLCIQKMTEPLAFFSLASTKLFDTYTRTWDMRLRSGKGRKNQRGGQSSGRERRGMDEENAAIMKADYE